MEHPPDRNATVARIAALNDHLRAHVTQPTGHDRVVFTAGIAAQIGDVSLFRGWQKRARLLRIVHDFIDFAPDSPERDFGRFEWEGDACFFKIDYYDPALEWASSDPADPTLTARVLTILWAHEY